MLQSLLALPLSAAAMVLLFLLLSRLLSVKSKLAAAFTALLALAVLLIYSVVDWPGADVLAMYAAVLMVTAYLLGIVGHARETQQTDAQGGWFHWAPMVIVVFFMLLFAVDGVFVVVSKQGLPASVAELILPQPSKQTQVRSLFPGTVANDFQKKESLYNAYLKQVERQQQRGWQVSKGWLNTPVTGRPAAFQVQVADADGKPVREATVNGQFQRPSNSSQDQSFAMQEIGPGLYRVVLTLSQPGIWTLLLQIQQGQQLHEVHANTLVKNSTVTATSID